MREVAFIKQNKDSWKNFEQMLSNKDATADDLRNLFIKINNDLSFAQTYYPKSKLVEYLNALASEAYHRVYKRKSDWKGIKYFWLNEVPLIMYEFRYYFYGAILFFLLCVAFGSFSTIYEDTYVRTILGDDYVDKTLDNIKNGDVTAVYNNVNLFDDVFSAVSITLNNLWVGLQNFFYGIFFGFGSLLIMFQNGIMVGSFQTMFYNEGVLLQSVRAIWIHGSMEIFCAMIEGGAGLLLGFSFLFPGSLSRKQSFIIKGQKAVKVVISTFPFTISAGMLEGFITQYANEMPLIICLSIILFTLAFIVHYYLIYPFKVAKKQGNLQMLLEEITND